MANFLEIAKRRYPNCCIAGAGRYAVVEFNCAGGQPYRVFMTETPEEQKRVALGFDHYEKVDLLQPVLANVSGAEILARIRDVYDPSEAREERRANRAS